MKISKKLLGYNLLVLTILVSVLEISAGYYYGWRDKKGPQILKIGKAINYKINNYGLIKRRSFNKAELIRILKRGNSLTFPPYSFDPQVHHPREKYWLTNTPNSQIVYCDEGSGMIIFKSNSLGLRSTGAKPNSTKIKNIYLGDSYVEGACIKNKETIPEKTAYYSGLSSNEVINLGKGGSGPLHQLALLKEYLAINRSQSNIRRNLIWVIFTGNDLNNLAEEKTTKLSLYLDKSYLNNYFNKEEINIIAKKQENFLNEQHKNALKNGVLSTDQAIGRHGYGETVYNEYSAKRELPLFIEILDEIRSISKNNNLNLLIVGLYDHPSKNKKVMKVFQNEIDNQCLLKDINCLKVIMTNIKGKIRGHFDEEGYNNLSKIISNELLLID
tara:strand:+ start:71 stop:1228 length:1158 start_codon:yes stop_codon:yes gene_type:complete